LSSNNQNLEKLTEFNVEEIKEYLVEFKKCILEGKYSISLNPNRQENIDFIEDYHINTKKEREILLGLQFDDFCYAVQNDNPDYAHEVLFVFCKQHELDSWGALEIVDIYIKVNMTETKSGNIMSFVISFHKRNFEIKYLFR